MRTRRRRRVSVADQRIAVHGAADVAVAAAAAAAASTVAAVAWIEDVICEILSTQDRLHL